MEQEKAKIAEEQHKVDTLQTQLINLRNELEVLTPQLDSLKEETNANVGKTNECRKKVADLETALAESGGPVSSCSLLINSSERPRTNWLPSKNGIDS